MKRGFFDEFPALWDAFARQLKNEIVKWIEEKPEYREKNKLYIIYHNVGFSFWFYGTGAGSCWKDQLEEVFFEYRYHKTIGKLYEYYELDMLAAAKLANAEGRDPGALFDGVVKPVLDLRKQELMAAFGEMEKELAEPQIYTLKVPVGDRETAFGLGFRNRCRKKKMWQSMDGYTYSFNGRVYKDIQAFRTPDIENLSKNVSVAKDTFGDWVLKRYTKIPTFDSGDREWDSEEIEYLMFDGRDINLIIMHGGYHIAHLTFYEKLLTADAGLKHVFEKLAWPTEDIVWVGETSRNQ